MSFEKAYAIFY